ncbi:MAG: histidine kinase, partial [Woeseiaceae bacterium]
IKASNPGAGDEFGRVVAINSDGTVLAVGAPGEDSDATGVNGAQDNEQLPDAGAVYVFQYDGVRWDQQAYVKASAPVRDTPRFGLAVAISAGGDRLAVGSPYEDYCPWDVNNEAGCVDGGAVYIFDFDGELWQQQAYLESPWGIDEHFGAAVALSADGNRLATSAPDLDRHDAWTMFGAVYVYDYDGDSWTGQLVGPPNDGVDFFTYDSSGGRLALSADGNRLAFDLNYWVFPGFERDGNWIAVYDFIGSTWQLQDWLRASNGISDNKDRFGGSLAMSGDGRMLAVGASGEAGIASGVNGDENDNSAERSGAAYLFALGSEGWVQTTYIKASNTDPVDMFGKAVALSFDGEILAAGASGEGSSSIGVDGDQSDNSAPASGAVFIY